jgi:hypothetical protein
MAERPLTDSGSTMCTHDPCEDLMAITEAVSEAV